MAFVCLAFGIYYRFASNKMLLEDSHMLSDANENHPDANGNELDANGNELDGNENELDEIWLLMLFILLPVLWK